MIAVGIVAFGCGLFCRTWRRTFLAEAIVLLLNLAWFVAAVVAVGSTIDGPVGSLAQFARYGSVGLVLAAVMIFFAAVAGHGIRIGFSGKNRTAARDTEAV